MERQQVDFYRSEHDLRLVTKATVEQEDDLRNGARGVVARFRKAVR